MADISWAVFCAVWCSLFVFSFIFTNYFLFKDYELRGKFVKLISSLTFSISCSLLILFLLELLEFSISPQIWQLNLSLYCLLMIYIIPLLMISKMYKTHKVICLLFLILYISITEKSRTIYEVDEKWLLMNPLSNIQFNYLSNCGIFFSALLSGFGAINCTYNYFNFFNEEILKETSNEAIDKCKQNIKELVKLKIANLVNKQKNQSIFGKIKNIFKETSELEMNLVSHEAVHQDHMKKIQQILINEEKKRIRDSTKGKFFYLLGKVMVVYSIYKIIMSSINYIFERNVGVDPITKSIQVISGLHPELAQYLQAMTTSFSVILVGALIFTNVRSFLQLLISLINLLGRFISGGLSTQILMFCISEATGLYFMATVLLMKANLPEGFRNNFENALGNPKFVKFHHMFDATFTVTAVVTSVILVTRHKLKFKKKTN